MDNSKPVSKAKVVSRKACLSDFLEDTDTTKQNEHTNRNHIETNLLFTICETYLQQQMRE